MEIQGNYLIYNGNYCSAREPVLDADNRAFLYGDGLFETIRAVNGKVIFFETHYLRLIEGMKALKMEIPAFFNKDHLEQECNRLLMKNQFSQGARVRLTVFRNAGGFYLPSLNSVSYTLVSKPVENNQFKLNDSGLSIDVYTDIKKPVNKLANFKTLNTQLFVMSSLYAREKGLNEVLILNENGNVIETSTSNVFLVSNGVLYTPSLEEGCLAGVMRMQIINLALELKLKVYECALTPQRLLGADEIFLTNTAKGIQWVNRYRAKRFYHKISNYLLERLNHKISSSMTDLQENLPESQNPGLN